MRILAQLMLQTATSKERTDWQEKGDKNTLSQNNRKQNMSQLSRDGSQTLVCMLQQNSTSIFFVPTVFIPGGPPVSLESPHMDQAS
jgi:hypothetical protein